MLALLLVAAAAYGQASVDQGETAPREVVPQRVPRIDLERLAPRTRERVEGLWDRIEELQEGASASDDLAPTFGELGRSYLAFEYYAAADDCFAAAERLTPEAPMWPYYRGMAAAAQGRSDDAAAHFHRVLERAPDDLATRMRLSRVRIDRGDLEGARDLLDDLVRDVPDLAAAHAALGEIDALQGRPAEAIRHLERALELMPEASTLHYRLAQQYRGVGDLEAAERHLAQRGAKTPGFPDPLARAVELERVDTAFGVVEQLAADVDSLPVEQIVGFALAQFGDVEGAIAAFERSVDRGRSGSDDPRSLARRRFVLGALHAGKGDAAAAREHYEAALREDPDLLPVRNALAWALLRQGEPAAAREELDRVLAADPEDRLALSRRAEALRQLGEHEAALADLDRLLGLGDVDAETHVRRAQLLDLAGRGEEAAGAYEAALALPMAPADRALAEQRLGVALVLSGRPSVAVQHLRRAVELDPAFTRARLDLGAALLRSGAAEEAAAAFGAARQRDDAGAEAWLGEASALIVLDRAAEARDLLEEGRSRFPQETRFTGTLARLLAAPPTPEILDGPRALALARELVEQYPSFENRVTLAMALAASQRYPEAVALQERLVREAKAAEERGRARALSAVLELYRAGKPCCRDVE